MTRQLRKGVRNMEKLELIIDEWRQLVRRAVLIGGGAPCFARATEDNAMLEIKGETAILAWLEYEIDDLDRVHLTHPSNEFPARLLLMSDEDIRAWKVSRS